MGSIRDDLPAGGSPSSADLLRRSQGGDPTALDELLRRHLPGVRAFVRVRMSALVRAQLSAEDLVQSACRALIANLHELEFRSEQAFRAWLYTAALRKLRHSERDLRAQKRDRRREVPWDSVELVECYRQVLTPSAVLVAEEQVRRLEEAFDTLPEDYREVIALSRIARLSRSKVAEAMGRTEAAVRSLLPRALVALAAALAQQTRGGE